MMDLIEQMDWPKNFMNYLFYHFFKHLFKQQIVNNLLTECIFLKNVFRINIKYKYILKFYCCFK